MGTTLTGTTPQDTYDSLIKVTDNGPLSGTAKYLSDGLGNDSTLALSTSRVGVGITSPQGELDVKGSTNVAFYLRNSSNGDTGTDGLLLGNVGGVPAAYQIWNYENGYLRFGTNGSERARIDAAGNVGIGTSAPVVRLDAVAAETGTYTTSTQQVVQRIYNNPSDLGSGVNSAFLSLQTTTDGGNANPTARIGVVAESYGSNNGAFVVTTREAAGNIEKMRVTSDGYLRLATGGIQFNGDTAAANALDDYEEGTWSPVIRGSGTAGTYEQASAYANYTKIGRQVTLNCQINLASSITAGGSGYLQITGVPFTKAASQEAMGSCWFLGVDFAGSFVTPRFIAAAGASTTVYFVETVDNSNAQDMAISGIAANDIINFSITYFV